MGRNLSDGTYIQSGITKGDLAGHPDSSYPFLHQGTVVARYFKDEEKNQSKSYTEYDVILWESRVKLRNVFHLTARNGFADGDVDTFRPAPGGLNVKLQTESEGDNVVVAFLDGDISSPVIIGGVPNIEGSIAPNSTEGEVKRIYSKGGEIEINKDGEVRFKAATGLNVLIDKDGVMTVGDGTRSVTLYEDLQPLYDAHKHSTAFGPSSSPLDPNILGTLNAAQSTKVKVPTG